MRGLISDRDTAYSAAALMNLSQYFATLIVRAADMDVGFPNELRVRNDLLDAISRAKFARELKDVFAESHECAELVGV